MPSVVEVGGLFGGGGNRIGREVGVHCFACLSAASALAKADDFPAAP